MRTVRISNTNGNMVFNTKGADHLVDTAETAMGLPALHGDTTHVFYSVSGAAVTVRFSGEDPDATTGHILANGTHGTWRRDAAQRLKVWLAVGARLYISEMTA